jgi:hypothetical protein
MNHNIESQENEHVINWGREKCSLHAKNEKKGKKQISLSHCFSVL